MVQSSSSLTFMPVNVPGGKRPAGMRLLDSPVGIRALLADSVQFTGFPSYKTVIAGLDLAQPHGLVTVLEVPQLLPVSPSWDVQSVPGREQLFWVFEQAGGALNSLALRDSTQSTPVALSANYPMQSFSLPRFVRHLRPGELAVTAVVDNQQLVVFPKASFEQATAYVKLLPAADGILLKTRGGYALFAKQTQAGSARNGVLPGKVTLYMLNDDLQNLQAVATPLADQLVYELDAALRIVDGREQLLLLATGPAATYLAISQQSAESFALHSLPLSQAKLDGLMQPALWVRDDASVSAVVLESDGHRSQLWSTTIPANSDF